jgi:hypothetical protein
MRQAGQPRLSELILGLGERANGTMTMRAVLSEFGERSFGTAMILFSALSLIPGASIIFAIPLLFISAQLVIGWKAMWLPTRLLDHTIASSTVKAMAQRIAPHLRSAERVLKPRGALLVSTPAERLAGLACLAMSIILFLPIPGANLVPALALICFALGLIEQDSLAMAAGWIAAAATMTVLGFVADTAWAAAAALIPDWLGL